MKRFMVVIFSNFIPAIGMLSFLVITTQKGFHWYDIFLFILALLVTVPSILWWSNFFERIFKIKHDNEEPPTQQKKKQDNFPITKPPIFTFSTKIGQA